jgi:hypothetical protein
MPSIARVVPGVVFSGGGLAGTAVNPSLEASQKTSMFFDDPGQPPAGKDDADG